MKKVIKILLIQKDIKQADIARKLGVSNVAVCNVIKGSCESKRIKWAIAKELGKKVEELWPDSEKAA
ncbi:MAG: helix-turn-helix domain-containing protein [Nitrospirae bacterium]|nr:helix-turn-helix domain-containing protein [Nitrospirota bacterium]